jgi:adenylyl-sulfate kinase
MPPRTPGAVVWFTGVIASGKSTLAQGVEARLRAMGLDVENLDADVVRANLSPNLGFTPEARDENTKRLAWLASLLSKYGVYVMVAAESPMRYHRDRARSWCQRFVEVYVDCPLEVCQQRDPKGLYAKAARGEVHDIAGIHQPYEPPVNPEVIARTAEKSVEECVDEIMAKLDELGYLPREGEVAGASQGGDSGEPYDEKEREQVEKRLRGLGYI